MFKNQDKNILFIQQESYELFTGTCNIFKQTIKLFEEQNCKKVLIKRES